MTFLQILGLWFIAAIIVLFICVRLFRMNQRPHNLLLDKREQEDEY